MSLLTNQKTSIASKLIFCKRMSLNFNYVHQLRPNIPNPHKKSHGNSLGSRSTLALQHNINIFTIRNKRAISQNFCINHRINTYTPTFWSGTKFNPLMSTSAAKRKNFILKTQYFALILQKLLFHGHYYVLGQIIRKYE
jgi:hypothetical protein